MPGFMIAQRWLNRAHSAPRPSMSTSSPPRPLGSVRNAFVAAIVVLVAFTAVGIKNGPPPIVGDELDYYSAVYAWGTNGFPAMSPAVLKSIRDAFPGRPESEPNRILDVYGVNQPQHFWFLGLLCTPFYWLCNAIGLNWKLCFTILNGALFAVVIGLCYRLFHLLGAAVLLAGLLSSPLLGYMQRAHAEFFTICLLAAALLYFQNGQRLAAALSLAFISAQLNAFSPITLAVIVLYVAQRGVRRLGRADWTMIVSCGLLLSLQPLWSIWRHHTVNLLITAGDIWLDMATPRRIPQILIDPDLGLFFTWPLCGAIVVLCGIGIARDRTRLVRYRGFWVFAILATFFLSFVAAQQQNYSTAAPRYSFWFIPFAVVGFLIMFAATPATGGRSWFEASCVAVFFVAASVSGYYQVVVRGVTPSLNRSPVAETWYRLAPDLYDPDEQTFVDLGIHRQVVLGRDLFLTGRFPVDRLPDRNLWALSNKACTKILVLAYAFTSSNVVPVLPLGCEENVDGKQLLDYVRQSKGPAMRDRFVTVPASLLEQMRAPQSTAPAPSRLQNQAPLVDSINATQTGSETILYTLEVSDANGWQDLKRVQLLVQGKNVGGPRCDLTYSVSRHAVWVGEQEPKSPMDPFFTPGESKTIRGQGCVVEVFGISATAQGDRITLSIPLRLDSSLLKGPSVIAASAVDLDGATSGWKILDRP